MSIPTRHFLLPGTLLCALSAFLIIDARTEAVPSAAKPKTATSKPNSAAVYGPWRSSKMGGGGYIQNVVVAPSNPQRLYTYVDVGGVFRSDDGGRRWRMLHGALPARSGNYEVRGLVVDPRDDKRVLIATGSMWNQPEGIYASNDAGATWRKTLTARFQGNGPERWTGFVLTRHPRNPDIVVTASDNTGAFISRDNGSSWQSLGLTGLHATDIRFDRSNPNRLWLCAQPFEGWLGDSQQTLKSGFYRSDDGGTNWSQLSPASPSEILQDPRDAGRLYALWDNRPRLSLDGGNTWQNLEDGLPPREDNPGFMSEARFQALAAGPGFILTASTRGTFYRLGSGETTWHKIERQGLEEMYEGEEWFRHKTGGYGWALGSITVDPRDANHWFFTDWFAIYQTFDAGKHWNLTIDGIEVTVLHALTQDPSDPAVVHLGMADNGYFWSENGGERFHLGEGISNNVKSISLSPTLPNRLYAVGPRTHEWEANQVFVSIDRGRTWTRSPMEGLPDLAKESRKCNTIVADAKNPYVVYLTVSGSVAPAAGGLYRSTDGGKKWNWFGDGLPTVDKFFRDSIWDQGREIASSPDGSLVCISREQSAAYRLDSATQKWTRVKSGGGAYYSVVADNFTPGRFFMGIRYSKEGLFRSNDGGATWHKIYDGTAGHVTTDAAVKGRVAAGTEDGVILSLDGGNTWQALDKRLPYRINNMVAFAGDRLIVGTSGNGAFWMPLSTQGAQPVRARPVVEARVPTALGMVPQVVNGDMSGGTTRPNGWNTPWTGTGEIEVLRDTTSFRSAPASLQLRSVGGAAYGTVSQTVAATKTPMLMSGVARSSGQFEEAVVAVQAFDATGKQIDWFTLSDVRDSSRWTTFQKNVALSPQTAKWNLVVTLRGTGAVWLDDFKIEAAPSVFLD
ncbi:MAG TPA: hypothetical protein VF600_06780 [Abditibacteriaceae bacterium]|jgi:photosystem II stability/assembly factor-like uncharacterized protein/guanyl-specific ribonuclease Sa